MAFLAAPTRQPQMPLGQHSHTWHPPAFHMTPKPSERSVTSSGIQAPCATSVLASCTVPLPQGCFQNAFPKCSPGLRHLPAATEDSHSRVGVGSACQLLSAGWGDRPGSMSGGLRCQRLPLPCVAMPWPKAHRDHREPFPGTAAQPHTAAAGKLRLSLSCAPWPGPWCLLTLRNQPPEAVCGCVEGFSDPTWLTSRNVCSQTIYPCFTWRKRVPENSGSDFRMSLPTWLFGCRMYVTTGA